MTVRTLLATLFLMSILIGCDQLDGDGDVSSSKYASFQEASQAGIFESGWLPRTLPQSARNIVEVHNIDSNEIWLRFSYSSQDIRRLTQACISVRKVQFPNTKRTNRDVQWWPKELTDKNDEQNTKRLTIFSCPKMQHASSFYTANVAVDTVRNTAWYWVTSSSELQ